MVEREQWGCAERRAVLILDADCTVSENLVEEIVEAMGIQLMVVQTAYQLESVQGSQKLGSPATIAFALKNVVRPRGMARLGIPTQLFGTGMCFRSDVLDTLTFDDHLTEDLKISHDLLLRGIAPGFVAGAMVFVAAASGAEGDDDAEIAVGDGAGAYMGKVAGDAV